MKAYPPHSGKNLLPGHNSNGFRNFQRNVPKSFDKKGKHSVSKDIARPDKKEVPYHNPQCGAERILPEIHLQHPRRNGDEGADHGNQLADEHPPEPLFPQDGFVK